MQAGVRPTEVTYVEAHGTGTVAGDAQELAGIEECYAIGGQHSPAKPLLIGSVKSNTGHSEGASGLTGNPQPPDRGGHHIAAVLRCSVAHGRLNSWAHHG